MKLVREELMKLIGTTCKRYVRISITTLNHSLLLPISDITNLWGEEARVNLFCCVGKHIVTRMHMHASLFRPSIVSNHSQCNDIKCPAFSYD